MFKLELGNLDFEKNKSYQTINDLIAIKHKNQNNVVFSTLTIMEKVLGYEIDYGHLLTYLFRRFGYPNKNWDNDKQLALYILTTPEPDLFIKIDPHIGGITPISIQLIIPDKIKSKLLQKPEDTIKFSSLEPEEIENNHPLKKYLIAAKTALEDLKTPVNVREEWLNAKGQTKVDIESEIKIAKPFEYDIKQPVCIGK